MLGHAFINGEIMPTKDASVPIDDIGFLRCFAIYEGITTVGIQPVFLSEHLDRLERSANLLGIKIPYERSAITKIILDLGERVTAPRGDIRVLLTGGSSADGLAPGAEGSFYAIVNNLTPLPENIYTDGASTLTHEYQRVFPECKTTHYTVAAMLQGKRVAAGASEVIYVKDGTALEATTSNLFVVKEGRLITPEAGILHGITRMKILELASSLGMHAERRPVTAVEMFGADEVFLTSSYKDVLPVVKIDDRIIGDGEVGEWTHQFMEAYQNLLKNLQVQTTVEV